MTAPRDPGLQPERTELSWRRTLLSLAGGALVSVRVLPDVLGDWTIVMGLLGVLAACVLWMLSGRRHAAIGQVFQHRAPTTAMPGGALLLAVSVLTSAGGVLGLLYAALQRR